MRVLALVLFASLNLQACRTSGGGDSAEVLESRGRPSGGAGQRFTCQGSRRAPWIVEGALAQDNTVRGAVLKLGQQVAAQPADLQSVPTTSVSRSAAWRESSAATFATQAHGGDPTPTLLFFPDQMRSGDPRGKTARLKGVLPDGKKLDLKLTCRLAGAPAPRQPPRPPQGGGAPRSVTCTLAAAPNSGFDGPAKATFQLNAGEDAVEQSDGALYKGSADDPEWSYTFDVSQMSPDGIDITFYENSQVQDEVGGTRCPIPARVTGRPECQEPIDNEDVRIGLFSCVFR